MNFFGETLTFKSPMPRVLLFWGLRDHGGIAMFHVDLRATQEVVLNGMERTRDPAGPGNRRR